MTRYRHGMSGTRVHNIWLGMLDRCDNDRSGNYGARGIAVCESWRSFEMFYLDMGAPPSNDHSLDRVDVNGDYEPTNCRWATRTEQARNTRRNTFLTYDGRTQTLAAWAEELGLKQPTVCRRLMAGWSVERALMTRPVAALPVVKPWTRLGMSRSTWYRAGRPTS